MAPPGHPCPESPVACRTFHPEIIRNTGSSVSWPTQPWTLLDQEGSFISNKWSQLTAVLKRQGWHLSISALLRATKEKVAMTFQNAWNALALGISFPWLACGREQNDLELASQQTYGNMLPWMSTLGTHGDLMQSRGQSGEDWGLIYRSQWILATNLYVLIIFTSTLTEGQSWKTENPPSALSLFGFLFNVAT